MPPPSLESRYAAASEHAKRLPQKLLTNSQRLKLYALFKQAEGPAPAQGPPFYQAVARAKWEAWNDVRSLSAQQAMESYCSIIEGLVAITQGTLGANGGTKVGVTQQEEAREHTHAGESAAQVVTALEGGAPSATSTAPARNAEDEGCDGADEPGIDAQRWAATALSLGPSTVFEVPIAVSEPSLCRYSFNVAAADGSAVGFSIGPANEPPLATVRAAEHEGQVEVHGDGTTMLIAKLDNSAVFSHLVVACEVILEPLSQLAARAAHRERAEMRARLTATKTELAAAKGDLAQLTSEADALRDQLAKVQQRLAANESQQRDVESLQAALQAEEARLLEALQ